jgi:hypothetical protein
MEKPFFVLFLYLHSLFIIYIAIGKNYISK